MKDYTNSQISELIDEHIHDRRARTALKLRLCDHATYAEIGEEINRTERQVGYILAQNIPKIAKYL